VVNEKQTLGQQGERAAISFLKTRGFTILETNYRTKPAEIDIIAKDNDCICFIEVKTRRSVKKGCQRNLSTTQNRKKS
jgi:putative endonuclease